MSRTKILSIDGGGIRGIIPAMVLVEVEKRMGKPISELFDLIAGTSTGGILASLLCVPKDDEPTKPLYKAEDVITLYEEHGDTIFSRSFWHKVKSLGGVIEEKYSSDGINRVLKDKYGEARLKDTLSNLFVTSYEIERRIPFFFKKYKAAKNPEEYDFYVWQIARATSAAPTYFEPLKIQIGDTADYYALIDGGVFANNPAMCAYVEARTLYKEKAADDFLLISLGTGHLTQSILYDDAIKWGLAEWVQPVLDVVFDGVSDTVDYELEQILNLGRNDKIYHRIQAKLTDKTDAIDNASADNIRLLRLIGEELVREKSEEIDEICKKLS